MTFRIDLTHSEQNLLDASVYRAIIDNPGLFEAIYEKAILPAIGLPEWRRKQFVMDALFRLRQEGKITFEKTDGCWHLAQVASVLQTESESESESESREEDKTDAEEVHEESCTGCEGHGAGDSCCAGALGRDAHGGEPACACRRAEGQGAECTREIEGSREGADVLDSALLVRGRESCEFDSVLQEAVKVPPILCFIAGPLSSFSYHGLWQNVQTAKNYVKLVAERGALPICPHANSGFMYGRLPEKFWREGYLELLRRCDVALFIPGWEASEGCLGEIRAAKAYQVPVCHTLAELENFIARRRLGKSTDGCLS
jgi:hypothetical protein